MKTNRLQTKKEVRQGKNKEDHPENLMRIRNKHNMLVTALANPSLQFNYLRFLHHFQHYAGHVTTSSFVGR